jgi:hypothetical protein
MCVHEILTAKSDNKHSLSLYSMTTILFFVTYEVLMNVQHFL